MQPVECFRQYFFESASLSAGARWPQPNCNFYFTIGPCRKTAVPNPPRERPLSYCEVAHLYPHFLTFQPRDTGIWEMILLLTTNQHILLVRQGHTIFGCFQQMTNLPILPSAMRCTTWWLHSFLFKRSYLFQACFHLHIVSTICLEELNFARPPPHFTWNSWYTDHAWFHFR